MDLSKFKTSDWLMVGAGLVMLILGFVLDWTSISFGGQTASGDGPFDYFFTGGIAWLLVVAVGVVVVLKALDKLPATLPWPLVILGAAALAALLMLIRIILGGRSEMGVDFDRGPGMYVAFVAAIVSAVGAFLHFKESGGDVNDLKDFNKIKSSFDKGDTAAPPPPPPAG